MKTLMLLQAAKPRARRHNWDIIYPDTRPGDKHEYHQCKYCHLVRRTDRQADPYYGLKNDREPLVWTAEHKLPVCPGLPFSAILPRNKLSPAQLFLWLMSTEGVDQAAKVRQEGKYLRITIGAVSAFFDEKAPVYRIYGEVSHFVSLLRITQETSSEESPSTVECEVVTEIPGQGESRMAEVAVAHKKHYVEPAVAEIMVNSTAPPHAVGRRPIAVKPLSSHTQPSMAAVQQPWPVMAKRRTL